MARLAERCVGCKRHEAERDLDGDGLGGDGWLLGLTQIEIAS